MVVSALVQLAIAGPVGILFGLGYGTAIRVGYEQVYPALFGDKELPKNTETILKKLESFYTSVGGLEAHKFGINQGIKNALKAIDADPELVDLIKKNSSLDSQTITVNLSGTSGLTQDSGQLVPSSLDDTSSTDIPSGLTMSILSYVKALADAAKLQKFDAYTELISQLRLSDVQIYWLVKNGSVTRITANHTIKVLWGLLTLEVQQKYIKIHNIENERLRELARAQGPQGTSTGGLTGDKQPIGVKWTKAAGQSQKLEKASLIHLIRVMKKKVSEFTFYSPNQQKNNLAKLNRFQQSLVNLLARYRF